MSKRSLAETDPVEELNDRIASFEQEMRQVEPNTPESYQLRKQIHLLKAERKEYERARMKATQEPLLELPVVGAAAPAMNEQAMVQAPYSRRPALLGGKFASRSNVRAPAGRAAAAVASHARAAAKNKANRLGKPGKRKALALRSTVESGITKYGRPRVVERLGPGHAAIASLGRSTAQKIAAAAAGGASVFARTWEGKGTGVTLSELVGDELSQLNMPSYGQYRNQLSAGLRDNAKYLLVQARAARIAYNKYKNQMWNRRSQRMRMTKYGTPYSHRKAGLREVDVSAPIAV